MCVCVGEGAQVSQRDKGGQRAKKDIKLFFPGFSVHMSKKKAPTLVQCLSIEGKRIPGAQTMEGRSSHNTKPPEVQPKNSPNNLTEHHVADINTTLLFPTPSSRGGLPLEDCGARISLWKYFKTNEELSLGSGEAVRAAQLRLNRLFSTFTNSGTGSPSGRINSLCLRLWV